MSETKHTPGPWLIKGLKITAPGARFLVADLNFCGGTDGKKSERDANLALIAAAPDMLEALKAITWLEDDSIDKETAVHIAIRAIAKAEGRAA